MSATLERQKSLADLVHDLGDIPLEPIRLVPAPGTATLRDVERARLCELVDGTLVEKAMGWTESHLAGEIYSLLAMFVRPKGIGLLTTPDGFYRLGSKLVRGPDVAFVSLARLGGRLPEEPIPDLVPDLAIEILSAGNTGREMTRKRREYFQASVVQVWEVDPRDRTVTVYRSARDRKTLTETDTLDGGEVLPGLRLPVADIFKSFDSLKAKLS